MSPTTHPITGPSADAKIPPLENGDRLTRGEFYRRWESMPSLKIAERIEGVIYMPAAVRFLQHGQPHSRLIVWLGTYATATPGTEVGDNSTLQLDLDNDPQPDGFLRISPPCGGQSATTDDGYIQGAPELIGEIAASSASYDLHEKLNVYRRNMVLEYLVWKVLEKKVLWLELKDSDFVAKQPDKKGVLKSAVFPGLWLDVNALLEGDMAAVLKTLQDGIATHEHVAFVGKLKPATGNSQ